MVKCMCKLPLTQTGPNGTAATLTAKILEDLQNISGTISSVQNLQVYAHKSTCIHFTVVSTLFAHSTVFRCTSKEIFLTLKWTLMGAKVKYVITHSQNVIICIDTMVLVIQLSTFTTLLDAFLQKLTDVTSSVSASL